MTDPTERAALRALLEAATPGPWTRLIGSHLVIASEGDKQRAVAECEREDLEQLPYAEWQSAREQGRADADLIAALRNAAPALLDDVERLERDNANARRFHTDEYKNRIALEAERDALRKALAAVIDAWTCSDGGGSGAESIGAAIDAARHLATAGDAGGRDADKEGE